MRKRILFVDDEPSLLYAVQQFLTDAGFDVDCALELEEAQALLSNIAFDVIVTDIRLTPLQGAEGLHVLGFARQRGLKTRLVVLTAYATQDVEGEARRLGVDAFLNKPLPLPRLAAVLTSLTEGES